METNGNQGNHGNQGYRSKHGNHVNEDICGSQSNRGNQRLG
jgi:hypothetical protein